MSDRLASADRSALVRLASVLPKGGVERRSILAGLKRTASQENAADIIDAALRPNKVYTLQDLIVLANTHSASDLTDFVEPAIGLLLAEGLLTVENGLYKA